MTDTRYKILLVDDEVPFLNATRRILSTTFEITTTESAHDALELLKSTTFDCVISDLRMPEMDGADLLTQAAEIAPLTGRIAMSAFSESSAIVKAINQGAIMAFVFKPFTAEDISSAIYRSVSRAQSARPSSTVLALAATDEERERLALWLASACKLSQVLVEPEAARRQLERREWDLFLIDLELPDALDLLHHAHVNHPQTWPIMLANGHSRHLSMDLVRLGARDMLVKPIHQPELLMRLHRLLGEKNASERTRQSARIDDVQKLLIGDSSVMGSVRQMIRAVAKVECAVLVHGETGTGKELVATALHRTGNRNTGPLLAVNCAALTESLFESEVFGHERGSFTGAVQQKKGLCEQADAGSLLLDEVGEISLAIQAKLLRFLETGEFYRVGGTVPLVSHARIIAATNRNLSEMVKDGTFRSDLYHRLSTIEIYVPPLREHPEDILQLVSHLLSVLATRHVRSSISIDHDALEELLSYTWPGNVRELQSVLERGLLLSPDGTIHRGLLQHKNEPSSAARLNVDLSLPLRTAVDEATRRIEFEYLTQLLAVCGGNVSEVAKRSGMDRRNLYRRLEALLIDPTRFRTS